MVVMEILLGESNRHSFLIASAISAARRQSRNFLLQAIDLFFVLPQVNFVSFLK